MKQGRTIQELAAEITRQAETKKDFIADTREMELIDDLEYDGDILNPASMLRVGDAGKFEVTDWCHKSMAQRLDIPKRYYDRMRTDDPELLKTNVNTWFQTMGKRRMVRTLDGNARAFLSDRYRRLDNFDLAEAVLPEIAAFGEDARVESSELTDTRLYLKIVFPKVEATVVGDIVQSDAILTNSEIGAGAFSIRPMVYTLACTNGMVVPKSLSDWMIRRAHLGGKYADEQSCYEILSDEAKAADDHAFWLKVRDAVRAAADQSQFDKIVQRMKEAAGQRIEGNPVKSVEVMAEQYGLRDKEGDSVLQHLLAGNNLNAYGLHAAVTRASQDVSTYERASELEEIGGKIIDLTAAEWEPIAVAI